MFSRLKKGRKRGKGDQEGDVEIGQLSRSYLEQVRIRQEKEREEEEDQKREEVEVGDEPMDKQDASLEEPGEEEVAEDTEEALLGDSDQISHHSSLGAEAPVEPPRTQIAPCPPLGPASAPSEAGFAWDRGPDIGLDHSLLSSIEAMIELEREYQRGQEEERLAFEAAEMIRLEEVDRLERIRLEQVRFEQAKARAIEKQGPTLLERLEKRKKETRARARVYVPGRGLHYAVEREEVDQHGRVIGKTLLSAKDYREFPRFLPVEVKPVTAVGEGDGGEVLEGEELDGEDDGTESEFSIGQLSRSASALSEQISKPPPAPTPLLDLNLGSSDWSVLTRDVEGVRVATASAVEEDDDDKSGSTASSSLSDILVLERESCTPSTAKSQSQAGEKRESGELREAVEHITKAFEGPKEPEEDSVKPAMEATAKAPAHHGRKVLENRHSYGGPTMARPHLQPQRFSMNYMPGMAGMPGQSMTPTAFSPVEMQLQAQAQAYAQAQAHASMQMQAQMQRLQMQSRMSMMAMPGPFPFPGGLPPVRPMSAYPVVQNRNLVDKVDQWRRAM